MDPVAVYAAVAATASLLWQVYSFWSEQRVRVRVKLSYGIGVGAIPDLLLITVVNQSRKHSVRVLAAGIALQDGSKRYVPVMDPLPHHELPQTIPPQDSGQTSMPISYLRGANIDPRQPMVAHVHLGTGEWVYSKPTSVRR